VQTANLRFVDRKQLRMMPEGMLKPGWLPRAHQGDPRMAVLSVMRLEYHQISLTKLPNMTVESRYRIGRSQSGCHPGGTCACRRNKKGGKFEGRHTPHP